MAYKGRARCIISSHHHTEGSVSVELRVLRRAREGHYSLASGLGVRGGDERLPEVAEDGAARGVQQHVLGLIQRQEARPSSQISEESRLWDRSTRD
jgi:hypothetical protein